MRVRWLAIGLLLGGCGSGIAYHRSKDWAYVNFPGIQPTLIHEFAPNPGRFAGTCGKTPTFLVLDGGWPAGVKRIELTADTGAMRFTNYGGAANALAMLPDGDTGSPDEAAAQRRLEAMLAGAHGQIGVATDNGWKRSVPAGPEIASFIAACHAWRKDHPATD